MRCPSTLEVRSYEHTHQWFCELVDGHDRAHRSTFMHPLQRATRIGLEAQIREPVTPTKVVIAWD